MIDLAQDELRAFSRTTEQLLGTCLRQYDSIADCEIVTSADLGIPNNVTRLSGGFPTGVVVTWRCARPFVPVDTTVNACHSSIYKIELGDDVQLDSDWPHCLRKELSAGTYIWNFEIGNHFIAFCRNEASKECYLVLHSSAAEFKDQPNGLYPSARCWYSDRIHTYREGSRYLRYILDREAEKFCELALSLTRFNQRRHDFIADWFERRFGRTSTLVSAPHYFMPSRQSVAMGCFLAKPGQMLPIFSAPGLPIDVVEVCDDSQLSVAIEGDLFRIVPHGWGMTASKHLDINVIGDGVVQVFGRVFDASKGHRLFADDRIGQRMYGDDNTDGSAFYRAAESLFHVRILQRLVQYQSYSHRGLEQWV